MTTTTTTEACTIRVYAVDWSERVSYRTHIALNTAAIRAAGLDPDSGADVATYLSQRDDDGQVPDLGPGWVDWHDIRDRDDDPEGDDDRIDEVQPSDESYQDAALWRMARQLGRYHGRNGLTPFGHPDSGDFDTAALMTALGETTLTTPDNHGHRAEVADTYSAAWAAPWG